MGIPDIGTRNVAVIGAGLMGHGIAQIFAARHFFVNLMDTSEAALDKAIENIRSNLSLLHGRRLFSPDEIEPAIGRIRTFTNMEQAAEEAGFIVEAAPEIPELKQNIFQTLDRVCPEDVILATNTSVISITEIASKCEKRERIVGTHFWNPPWLIPLVEVIRGRDTDDRFLDQTFDLMQAVGKKPVFVQKDVPGFVGNRLQHALWREAVSIVENGIADPATVDQVIADSFGLRLPVLGPMANADLVGLDLTWQVHDYLLKHIEDSHEPSPLLKRKIEQGHLGFKTGEGFREWTPEETDDVRRRLFDHLLDVMGDRKGK